MNQPIFPNGVLQISVPFSSEVRHEGNYLVPFAADPDRSIYSQFAQKKVPRNYLFNKEGQLVYQTRGFDLDQLSTLGKILKDLYA